MHLIICAYAAVNNVFYTLTIIQIDWKPVTCQIINQHYDININQKLLQIVHLFLFIFYFFLQHVSKKQQLADSRLETPRAKSEARLKLREVATAVRESAV